MNFNKELFLENTKKTHLSNSDEVRAYDAIQDTDVRERLDTFIDYDRSLFSKALDELCANVVSNTMFKLLMLKKPPGMRLKIVDIGPEQARSRKSLVDQKGSSCFWNGINVNPNVYNRSGIGIPDRQYYCIDERGNITIKLKSLSGSIFHEFVHCLHYIEDARRCGVYVNKDSLPKGNPWTDKEERRAISGYIEADTYTSSDTYDPICDNCFHLYDAIAKSAPSPHHPARPTIVKPIPCRQGRVAIPSKTPYH